MVEIDFDIPINLRLKLDSQRVEAAVGRKIAAWTKKRIRAGRGLRRGQTLRDTDKLLKSIKYSKYSGVVRPTGRRSDVTKRAGGNYGLMRIHISGKYRKKGYQRLEYTDPMGSNDPKLPTLISQWLEEAIAKELASGRGSLLAELQRSLK